MSDCFFCKKRIEPGTGKMIVGKDGSVKIFCGSKCERNFFLGRIPKKLKWANKK